MQLPMRTSLSYNGDSREGRAKALLSSYYEQALGVFLFVLTIFWLVVPLGTNPTEGVEILNNSQEFLFRFGALFFILISFFLSRRQVSTLNWVLVFGIYALADTLLIGYTLEARRGLLNLCIGILFIKSIAESVDLGKFKIFCYLFLILVVVNLILSVFQYFSLDPLYSMAFIQTYIPEPTGFLRLNSHLGTMTAISAPFLFFLNPYLVILCLPLLFFSKSSVAVVSFLVGIGYLILKKYGKKVFFIILGLIVLLGVGFVFFYDMPSGNFGYRIDIWGRTISEVLKKAPIFGFGLGQFAVWAPKSMQSNGQPLVWLQCHNEILQTWFEIGIVGVLIIFAYLKDITKKAFQGSRHIKSLLTSKDTAYASVMIIFMNSLINFPFHLARLAGISCLAIGLLAATQEET